jgi:hypothetical protein
MDLVTQEVRQSYVVVEPQLQLTVLTTHVERDARRRNPMLDHR